MKNSFKRFISDEAGVITVQMMVLIAALVVMIIAVMAAIGPNIVNRSQNDVNSMQFNR